VVCPVGDDAVAIADREKDSAAIIFRKCRRAMFFTFVFPTVIEFEQFLYANYAVFAL